MVKLKEFIQRAKAFINENPQRKKLLLIIFILAIIPLTVLAALTVQDLRQRAGGASGIQILDASGNFISTTSDTNVRLRVTLPENWVSLGMETNKQNFINQAYAQTNQCRPPYQGYLGCFSSSDSPFGSICTSSCTTDSGENGQYCYTSTTIGSSCTSSTGRSGVCDEQGECAANVYPTPVYFTPIPSSPPQSTANCGNQTCSITETCIGTSFDSSTFCLTKGVGGLGSYCGSPNKSPNNQACSSGYCDSTLRCANQSQETTPIPVNPTATPTLPTSGINPTSGPTPKPILNVLQGIYIENKDSDGSSNGSEPLRITSGFESYIITSIPWKLNDLLPGQTQALRIAQVTLFSDSGYSITLSASVNLVRPNGPTNGIQLRPHVYILEDDGTFDTGNSASITKKFYEKYPDQYDFIGFQFKGGAMYDSIYAYHVQDSAQKGNFGFKFGNLVTSYGSKGRLLGGYVDSSDFDKVYVESDPDTDPISLIDTVYFRIPSHELTHYWGVTLPDELKEAQLLLNGQYDTVHFGSGTGSWIAKNHTTRIKNVENIDGKYYHINDCSKEPKHHDFDLYSMGLKSPEEVKDKLVIVKPFTELPYPYNEFSYGPWAPCDTSIELSKDLIRKTYTIQDFIDVLGPRIPSVADSQKDFTIAFVLIISKGETLSQKQIDALNWIADKFPIAWYKSTEGRSTLNGIKPKDITKPIISNVKTSATKSSIAISWTTNEPATAFAIYTQTLNLRPPFIDSIYPNVITNPPKFSTSHEINIESSDWPPLSSNTEYPVKIISIDEDYNMASFDAGKIITTDVASPTTPSTAITNTDYDLNSDGVVNCKDVKILIGQYGQKGAGLSADLNHDGIVDNIDYNTLVRNYTPGDTTVCPQ